MPVLSRPLLLGVLLWNILVPVLHADEFETRYRTIAEAKSHPAAGERLHALFKLDWE